MGIVQSAISKAALVILGDTPYWAVKLEDGRFLSERDIDWSLDLVATGDIKKIKELWLFCPPSPLNPLGSTARLPIVEPGTAFQFKVSSLHCDLGGDASKQLESQVIGRITDKESGDCEYFVYDAPLRAMSTPMKSNIHKFGRWRPGIAPLGALSLDVLGVAL